MATDKPSLGVGGPTNPSSSSISSPIDGAALPPLPSPYQLHHAGLPSSGHASANGGGASGVGQDMMASLLAAAKRTVAQALPTAPTAPSPASLLGCGFPAGPPPPGRIVSSYPVPAAAAPVDAPAALALASLSRDSPQVRQWPVGWSAGACTHNNRRPVEQDPTSSTPLDAPSMPCTIQQAQHALWGGLQHPAVAPFSGPPRQTLPPGPGPIGGGYGFLPPPTTGAMDSSGLVARFGVGTATTSTSTVSSSMSVSSTASSGTLHIKGGRGTNGATWGCILRRECTEDANDARAGAYGAADQGEGVALGKRPRAEAAAVGGALPAAGWPVKPLTTCVHCTYRTR